MKRHLILSLLLALPGIGATAQTADDDSATGSSTTSSSGPFVALDEDRDSGGQPGDDTGGEVSRPALEPLPDMSPEEAELIAYREELGRHIEAGELTQDEAIALFEELVERLGFGREPDEVIDIGEVDERQRLADDFRQELDLQVRSGELSEDEAQAQWIDFMIELGLIMTIDVEPSDPPEPRPMPPVNPETSLRRFEEVLVVLVDNDALTPEQVREQVAVFADFLANGEEQTLPHPDMNLTMDQAELVYMAREFSLWYTADEFEVADLQQELLHVAMSLGVVEGGDIVVQPEPRPDPNRDLNEELLLGLREDLARQVEEGLISEEEAKELFYAAAEELNLIDDDGTVVILPGPGTPPVEPRPAPEEYEPTPVELEMMSLLHELAVLIDNGDLTADEAWERLAAIASEEGWDLLPFDGPDVDDPSTSDPDTSGPDTDSPGTISDTEAKGGGVLLALRSNLASQVHDDALSSGEAWDELTQALDPQAETADSDGTAIQATSWGTVKASMR